MKDIVTSLYNFVLNQDTKKKKKKRNQMNTCKTKEYMGSIKMWCDRSR